MPALSRPTIRQHADAPYMIGGKQYVAPDGMELLTSTRFIDDEPPERIPAVVLRMRTPEEIVYENS